MARTQQSSHAATPISVSVLRGGLLVFIFAILITGGFLLSPSVLVGINFGYQIYVRETSDQLQFLNKQKADLAGEVAKQTEIATEAAATGGRDTLSPDDKARISVDVTLAASRGAVAKSQLTAVQAQIDEIEKKRDSIYEDSETLYLVVRALCLGALGTLVLALTKFVSKTNGARLFDEISLGRMLASMVVGSMVSVVAFGLFYTKQISLFKI